MDIDPEIYKQLLHTFEAEFNEQVEELTKCLIELEKSDDQERACELLNQMFRVAHTIKGAARSVEIMSVGEVAHALEDLFSVIKNDPEIVTPAMVDLCFKGIDHMCQIMTAKYKHDKDIAIDEQLLLLLRSSNDCGSEGNSAASKVKPSGLDKEANVANAEVKSTRGSDAEFVRVGVDLLDKITSLCDEVQGAKLQYEDAILELHRMQFEHESLFEDIKVKLLNNTGRSIQDGEADSMKSSVSSGLNMSAKLARLQTEMNACNRGLGLVSASLQDQVKQIRMVPVEMILTPMMRSARELSRSMDKEVSVNLVGGDCLVDKYILDRIKDPMMHLLRNAIDHGVESKEIRTSRGKNRSGTITISVKSEGDRISLSMEDDGGGIDVHSVRALAASKGLITSGSSMSDDDVMQLLFHPGFSTKEFITDVSGRGVGLDVVMSNVQAINGNVRVISELKRGTTFSLIIPLTVLTDRGLIIGLGNQHFAIPTSSVVSVTSLMGSDVIAVPGGHALIVDEKPVPLRRLSHVLDMASKSKTKNIPVVVVRNGVQTVAFEVDSIESEKEIVIKNLSMPLCAIKNVSGAALTGRGEVIIVLNPSELVDTALTSYDTEAVVCEQDVKSTQHKKKVLVVDDSITTRTLESNILKMYGYEVRACVDGEDAWNTINSEAFDAIITDVEMPHMNGFDLAKLVKQDNRYSEIPVVIVTSLGSDEDKRRGIEVGADAYLVKSQFDTRSLINTVERLI